MKKVINLNRRRRRKKKLKRSRLALISVIAAVFFVGLFLAVSLPLSPKSSIIYDYTYQNGDVFSADGKNLITVASGRTFAVSPRGKLLWEVQTKCTAPILRVQNDCCLIAEQNGNNLYLISNGTILYHKILEYPIYNATLSDYGNVIVSMKGNDCLSQISVFSKTGNEIFAQKFSSKVAIDMCLSKNNKTLAVLSTYIDSAHQLTSNIIFEDIATGAALNQHNFADSFVKIITFQGKFYSVSDTNIIAYDKAGNISWEEKFNSRTLQNFELLGGKIHLAFKNINGATDIETISLKGKLLDYYELDFPVEKILYNNSGTFATDNQEVFLLSRSKTAQLPRSYISLIPASNFFYAISYSGIEKVTI